MARCCWKCGRNGRGDPLDRHHVFGGSRRKKSEKYGAVVDLCHWRCHEFGPEAVHNNAAVMLDMRQYWQRRIMEEQGWTVEMFIAEFGKNYI